MTSICWGGWGGGKSFSFFRYILRHEYARSSNNINKTEAKRIGEVTTRNVYKTKPSKVQCVP